ncbi:MAG: hypothetical protein ACTHLK_22920 [Brucella intermedia]
MKASNYMNRALQSRDPRFKEILGKLGYERADIVSRGEQADDLGELRKEYQEVIGKRAFNGWDAATLKAKIAEAKGAK